MIVKLSHYDAKSINFSTCSRVNLYSINPGSVTSYPVPSLIRSCPINSTDIPIPVLNPRFIYSVFFSFSNFSCIILALRCLVDRLHYLRALHGYVCVCSRQKLLPYEYVITDQICRNHTVPDARQSGYVLFYSYKFRNNRRSNFLVFWDFFSQFLLFCIQSTWRWWSEFLTRSRTVWPGRQSERNKWPPIKKWRWI